MFSNRTKIEIVNIIDELTHGEIDRILIVFGLRTHLIPNDQSLSKSKKSNIIYDHLNSKDLKGPFTESFQLDILQYIIDDYFRKKKRVYSYFSDEQFENQISTDYPLLANSLKKDGYIVKGTLIKKLLPEEIAEAKIETELIQLLNKFLFTTTKGHLDQAIDNYVQGNWAGANSQFRPFIESLLIEISKSLLPSNQIITASSAIKLLSNTVSPPFLRSDLNEIESPSCDKPFIDGFWKRLHPQGAHPGLSDEEDSTFRYHLTIVVAHYLLKRYEKRK